MSQIRSCFDELRIKIRTEFDPMKWNSIFVDVKAVVVDESCRFKRYRYYLTRNLSGEGVTKLCICLDMKLWFNVKFLLKYIRDFLSLIIRHVYEFCILN